MSDLSSGSHANLVLSPSDVYRVSTGGTVTVQGLYGAPSTTTTITAGTQDFGPYGAHAKLKVTATSGPASYHLRGPAEPATLDPDTGEVIGLGGARIVIDRASDPLPSQTKTVSATGQVVAGPAKIASIRCLAGTSPTLVLRDSVVQTVTGTDTTSPQLISLAMAIGEVVKLPLEAFFGIHATVGGTDSPSFELEF